MKKKYTIVLILFLCPIWACSSDNTALRQNCLQVKVVESLCGQAVLQVVNPNSFELELQSWTDGGGVMYENVFSTVIPCNADQSAFENGSQLYVEIIEAPLTGDCIRCLALLANAPEITYPIKVVEKCD